MLFILMKPIRRNRLKRSLTCSIPLAQVLPSLGIQDFGRLPSGLSGSAVIHIENPQERLRREQLVIAYKCVTIVGWKIVYRAEPR